MIMKFSSEKVAYLIFKILELLHIPRDYSEF